MPPGVKKALAHSIQASERYPDPACRALREALARFEGVPKEFILCGGGATDLLYRVIYALRPERALLLAPTFQEYELALAAAGSEIRHHLLGEAAGFSPDESLLQSLRGCDLILLCNPNNPTGVLMEPALLAEVFASCAASDALLVVDECFLDFLAEPGVYTLKPRLADCGRLILLRAFTKSFALPGLRLGHALCSDPALLRRIDEAGPTWSVSTPAQVAGIAACGEEAYLRESRARLALLRPALQQALRGCGLRVYRGDANYILIFTPDRWLAEKLMAKGILIRDCGGFRGLSPGFFRIAVRGEEDNARLIRTIKECHKA